jgi:GDP-D-mannose dehydratase
MVISNICNIIHKNNWNTKVFNASSSEMFKGYNTYHVKEDDVNFFHCHPYSIGKILGHSMIDFYRNNYNLPFSNGILFTIESKYKKGDFLLNKVAKHAKKWKENHEPILLGQLTSYRNILHANDAAKAIRIIMEQNQGDNYIISNSLPNSTCHILDLVFEIYNRQDIFITQKDNLLIETNTNNIVAIMDNGNKGIDITPTKITGEPNKLMQLGWNPRYDISYIIDEISN